MIRGLCYQQADAVIDIKLGNAEADTYKYEPMAALLDWWEIIKKDKHGKHCQDQGKNFSVCYSCRRNARERSPGRTCKIDSNHDSKNGQTHFTYKWLDKRPNHNCCYEILLTYDPQISTPQSPAGQGAGLGYGIRNRVGTLNCAQD